MSLPRFAGVPEKELKKLVGVYERGLKDLQSGADEVVLYRHDLAKKIAFTRATLPGLEQQLAGMRVALGIEVEPAPKRRWA